MRVKMLLKKEGCGQKVGKGWAQVGKMVSLEQVWVDQEEKEQKLWEGLSWEEPKSKEEGKYEERHY